MTAPTSPASTRRTEGRNAFQETLLGIEYGPRPDVDLFSQACVEQFQEFQTTAYGYDFAQVFEPNALTEVALLAGLDPTAVADLTHRPTPGTVSLAELTEHSADLPVVGLVNVASALISVSRFGLAERLLDQAAARSATARETFEVAMLELIVANRRDDGVGSPRAFARMRQAIETGGVPADRSLDGCSQAVVWYLKRKELPEESFRWYLRLGRELVARHSDMPTAAVSSWYRALAMSPAAEGDAVTTRQYMDNARRAAEETYAHTPRAYELHLLKTYHESSIKEHLYVTGDIDRAVESGRDLIALDPVWAPSYGELGEVLAKAGRAEAAARMYEKAAELGPPYYGHHLLQAARLREKAGDGERALGHYQSLTELAPDSEPLLEAGLVLARTLSHDSAAYFDDALGALRSGANADGSARS
ncbi:hypothetical protein [Streptomyces sp. 62]|uniref:hypothetical protein n=1 Tax=Streptomyces sp. NPDC012756 TaxID=3364847 RepID=UPI000E283814